MGGTVGIDPGDHLGHVRVDVCPPQRTCHRDPMVTIADEVDFADPDEIDRRKGFATAHRRRDALPPAPHPRRRGAEAPIEVASAVDGAENRVERHDLQAEGALAHEPEGFDHLLVGEGHTNVVGLAPQPGDQPRRGRAPARTQEVMLRIHPGHASGARQRHVAGATACWSVARRGWAVAGPTGCRSRSRRRSEKQAGSVRTRDQTAAGAASRTTVPPPLPA